ncbi:hypothetical protein GTS_43410 [Gandjariella thermophila]|uniref:Uncharacterized protein n=1 Tax=Gandjariella thermophila TaxID=1931992 RepID=A0A4D4JDH9_9PSEU|nr:hypothetical protein GTS_43410 [Gandjariella thermophila]
MLTRKFIAQNPNTTRTFVTGVAKAIEWARTRPREEVIAGFTVFQQYALLPWRTAQGNVEFGLEAVGVVFDNRGTQHYAPDDYGDLPRRLHRVTVAGDAPVGIAGARSYVVAGDGAAHHTPAV